MIATSTPAATSSQEWLPVAIAEDQTPAGQAHQEVGRVDEALEGQLDQPVDMALEADHLQPVVEGLRRVAVGDPARSLVGEQEPEPDAELLGQVSPPAGENPASYGGERRHGHINFKGQGGGREKCWKSAASRLFET